ncbi:MAG: hypothetical protein JSS49_30035 [Planctomycetes bacterium]|nr:hypothetical protein [Planctomycetota bacterium]
MTLLDTGGPGKWGSSDYLADGLKKVGQRILTVLRAPEDESVASKVQGQIREFCTAFPVPGIG